MESPRPLDGVKVVSFGQWYAGPLVAMHLAEAGATVKQVCVRRGRIV